MKTLMFDSDDRTYLQWAEGHPDGYVVNLRRQRDASYVVLHRATCRSVHRYAGIDANPGGFTERGYRKLCGTSLPEVIDYLRREFGRQQPITKECLLCVPE
jgi:hypothetical protein